jgi:outer membrane protein OmpA-like peptidoglycan-associated protein
MKTLKLIFAIIALLLVTDGHAQFLKKLKKRAAEAAERTIERKVEEKTEKETEKAFDTVFNSDGKIIKKNKKGKSKKVNQENENGNSEMPEEGEFEDNTIDDFEIYSNFDFIPGDAILLVDDFSLDQMGDFPAKWNTNGTGELVLIENEKWLQLAGKSLYIPDVSKSLPENYTIEFDMLTDGLDQKTSSQAKLEVWFEDHNQFQGSKNKAIIEIPLCLFISTGFIVDNKENGERVIRNTIEKDIREIILEKVHVSIAVNGQRYRMWMNENKIVDIPRLIPENIVSFKLHPREIRDGIDKVFVNNFKIAEAEADLRSQLLNKGRFSTTGILFNSGSNMIKPESYAVLKQISDALNQEMDLKLNIIGHTDADGDDENNLVLSQQRAQSVKNLLVTQFQIDENRLQTEGKGESEPVSDNTSNEGKANNRRVEFVKI